MKIEINKDSSFEFIDDINVDDNFQVYYEKLHGVKVLIFQDNLNEFFNPFYKTVQKCLENKNPLETTTAIIPWLEYLRAIFSDIEGNPEEALTPMWETVGDDSYSTWLYKKNDNFVIEISPNFNGELFKLGEMSDEDFKKYQKELKPSITIELSTKQLIELSHLFKKVSDQIIST